MRPRAGLRYWLKYKLYADLGCNFIVTKWRRRAAIACGFRQQATTTGNTWSTGCTWSTRTTLTTWRCLTTGAAWPTTARTWFCVAWTSESIRMTNTPYTGHCRFRKLSDVIVTSNRRECSTNTLLTKPTSVSGSTPIPTLL